ncbi:MAG: dsbB [Rhodospirillaceae bacterium]|nr:MAG: dsbB [Rhodospirillaceae bacterium]
MPYRRVLVALCGVTFGGNAGLAFYHVGIENHWWTASVCTTVAEVPLSLADLQAALERPAEVSCDVVQWSLFGLSLSGYNLLASLGLAMLCMAAASQKSWWRASRNV